MRHPLLRNLDVGQEPRRKQTSVSLPADSFLHYACTGVPSFASGFLCNGAWGSICVLHCSPAHLFVGMLLLLHVFLSGRHTFTSNQCRQHFQAFTSGYSFRFLFPQVLSGLVACTASCDVATPTASIVIGLLSGLVVSGLIRVLASHCISLDDYCLMNT